MIGHINEGTADVRIRRLDHIPSLDGLWAIAILLVIGLHYVHARSSPAAITPEIKTLTSWWWAGVDLFFVLSGFLIGRILINAKGTQNFFKVFYLRRFLRIFPAYFLVLGVFVTLLATPVPSLLPWLFEPHFPIEAYALYIQNFYQGAAQTTGARWLGVTWSLAIEEQFYLLLPLLVYLTPKRVIPLICLAGILAAPIIRYIFDDLNSYISLPARMDSLLVGVLIGWLNLRDLTTVNHRWLLAITSGLLLSILVLVFQTDFEKTGGVLNHSLLALFFGVFLLLSLNARGLIHRILVFPPLTHLGKISYMVYLTHQIFNGTLHGLYKSGAAPSINERADVVLVILAFTACIAFCSLSYRYFERPILSLGTGIQYWHKDEAINKTVNV